MEKLNKSAKIHSVLTVEGINNIFKVINSKAELPASTYFGIVTIPSGIDYELWTLSNGGGYAIPLLTI